MRKWIIWVILFSGCSGSDSPAPSTSPPPPPPPPPPGNSIPLTVMAYGDSITWGLEDECNLNDYPSHYAGYILRVENWMRENYPQYEFTFKNAAVPGSTSAEGLAAFSGQFDALRPNLLFLMYGQNNYFQNKSYTKWQSDLREMASYALEHGAKVLLIGNPPVSKIHRASQYAWMKDFQPPQKWYSQLASDLGIPFVDVWTEYLSIPNWESNYLASSGGSYNHPNCAGYNFIAELVKIAIPKLEL